MLQMLRDGQAKLASAQREIEQAQKLIDKSSVVPERALGHALKAARSSVVRLDKP